MTERQYLPAMGRHGLLFLYGPLTRLAGLRRVHRALLDRAAVQPGHRALEIGCGPGGLVLALGRRVPQAEVLGIDPDPAALRRGRRKAARQRLAVRFEQAFADQLPLADDSVDRVLSCYMLHHLDAADKARTMTEIRRVLRPGGELHVADVDGTSHSHRRRPHPLLAGNTPDQIITLMREAGLRDAAETGRGHRPGPLGTYVFYRATA
jgi:ubiquinone/menaquinone biosynthesis C-methylase UbiE